MEHPMELQLPEELETITASEVMCHRSEQMHMQEPDVEHAHLQIEDNTLQSTQKEDVFTGPREIHELELSKTREHDSLSFNHRLRIESEMLAKMKAKEEVMTCILSSHVQESSEKKVHLANEISDLKTFKEELDQKMKMELFQRSQLEKEMNNNLKTIEILKHYHNSIEKEFETIQKHTKNLELQQEEQFKTYKNKKLEVQKQLTTANTIKENFKKEYETKHSKYTTKIRQKNDCIKISTDAETKLTEQLTNLNTNYTTLSLQCEEENSLWHQLSSENQSYQNSATCLLEQIQVSEAELNGTQCDDVLNGVKNNLTSTLQLLNTKEDSEVQLQKKLQEYTLRSNENEAMLSNLDDESISLSTNMRDLEDTTNEHNIYFQNICLSLESKLSEVTNNLMLEENTNQSDEHLKTEKAKVLSDLQQEIHNNEQEVTMLQISENQLKGFITIQLNSTEKLAEEADDLKNRNADILVTLLKLKEQYFHLEQMKPTMELELSEQLSTLEQQLLEIKQKGENKILTLKDELGSYKNRVQDADRDNVNKYNKTIKELQEQHAQIIFNIEESKENFNRTKSAIVKEQIIFDSLLREKDILKQSVILQDNLKLETFTNDLIKPASILKAPGTPATSKKVSFLEPNFPWIGSTPYTDSENIKSMEHTMNEVQFEKLVRTSPPQRLQDFMEKKRSRLDSP